MSVYSDLEWAILEELLSQRDNRDGLIIDGDVVVGDRFVFAEGTIDIPALAAAVRRSLDHPPEGKLRVRVLVGLVESGDWYAHSASDGSREDFEEVISMAYEEPQFRWIEADVTPWQPPAEETVQGREVEG